LNHRRKVHHYSTAQDAAMYKKKIPDPRQVETPTEEVKKELDCIANMEQ